MRHISTAGVRRRIRLWFLLFSGLFVLLAAKLFVIQVLFHPALAKQAEQLQRVRADLFGVRGTVFDRNGVPLAFTRLAYSIFADPKRIDPTQRPAAALASVLRRPEPEIAASPPAARG